MELILLLVWAGVLVLLLALPRPRMQGLMAARVGRWVWLRLHAAPDGEYCGRLLEVDGGSFALETLDGRRIDFNAGPRGVLAIGDMPNQEALQLAWAENQQRQADTAGRH